MGTLASIVLIAISLALDAVAVSIAGGLAVHRLRWQDALKVGLYFGGFQAGMPLLGWLIGSTFRGFVASVSGWVAFGLLAILGIKMIKEALEPSQDQPARLLNHRSLLLLAIATSIDALVVGVTLNLVNLPLAVSAAVIGVITFGLSAAGFWFGKELGGLFSGKKVEIAGGLCLIAVGLKLLLAS